MLNLVPEDLERYIATHSSAEPEIFEEIARETRASTKDPQMMAGHVQGLMLKLIARATGARRVLEIGTFTGYSALAFAEGIADGGEVITCDVSEKFAAIARRFWQRSPHGKKITLRLGPALDTVSQLDGTFDIVFIDADKERYIDYWEVCLPKVRSGGLVLVDNVLWGGEVLDPVEPLALAVAAFNEHVAADERVEKVILPVRDGVTLACKR
jgi:caffeoyl-CoA O-methyltransferase